MKLAAKDVLPELVELGQISAAICTCTPPKPTAAPRSRRWRSGAQRGYEYIAITDHSKSLAMTNGLDEHARPAFAARSAALNQDGGLGIRIFSGIECDIMRDGAMDLRGMR